MFIPGFCRSFVYLFTPVLYLEVFTFSRLKPVSPSVLVFVAARLVLIKYKNMNDFDWVFKIKHSLFPMCRRVRRTGTKIHLINVNTHLFSKSLVSKWTKTRSATGLSQRHKLVAIFAPISPFQNLVRCLHTTYSNGHRSFRPQSFAGVHSSEAFVG